METVWFAIMDTFYPEETVLLMTRIGLISLIHFAHELKISYANNVPPDIMCRQVENAKFLP
jgi:hypothetical protein